MSTDFIPNHDNNSEDSNPKKKRIKYIKGSPEAVTNTIYSLYALGYADVSEWSPLQPTGIPGEVISFATKSSTWR
ncbi:MAG: hypothetical protein F6J94_31810 [Moorea sp. SIO1F2]|uniref:hypothetical protein n=1 Tax=unclassified Moorena TaxID=2683338 RepID=UPI0013B6E2F2|nr:MULTISPECIES: hypothetical protein [unclassified Moorena]NEN97966.1 hypothetical protein [Moorena sp. SIO3I7]NEO10000.1 hypothetical protein [Moorena sp. SIO3I8]NEO18065.1 hypothetical protein [Moorena sp. SIO4A5]NEP23181.1 hypothetical protein [Moorena sp. SIO3I6]NEQ58291.1 hypothetical protein [Moorena sp. SIO4A1]